MDKTKESLNGELYASENSQTQVNELDNGFIEQSVNASLMKQSSSDPDEKLVSGSHDDKESVDDHDKTSRTGKESPKSENDLVIPVDKQGGNAPDAVTNGDGSQGLKSVITESKAEKVDSSSKDCEEEHCNIHEQNNRDVQVDEVLAESEEENMEEVYSEEDEEGEEEDYLEDEDEYVPVRNRRRHFGDSDEDEEEIDEEESYHDDASQSDNECEQDPLPVEEDEICDVEKTLEDEVEAKSKKNNRRDPTFVPREGAFFMHDARDASGDDEEADDGRRQSSRPKPSRSRAGISRRWSHDLYDEREQQPRSTNEIISRYGCNIRERDIDQIAEVTFSLPPIQRRSNNPRGRGRFYRQSQNLPKSKLVVFAENDFPTLQETEQSSNRRGPRAPYDQRRGGFTFSRDGNFYPRRPNFRKSNPQSSEEVQNRHAEPQRRQILGDGHQGDDCAPPDSQNRPQGRQGFHQGNNRRNIDTRSEMDVTIYNSNSKRYSTNRLRNNGDVQSQQQPTGPVVIRDQPDQSQRPQNNRAYSRNNNRNGQRNRQNRKKLAHPQSHNGPEKASTSAVREREHPQGSVGLVGDSAPRDGDE